MDAYDALGSEGYRRVATSGNFIANVIFIIEIIITPNAME